jgi:hypothetical protein
VFTTADLQTRLPSGFCVSYDNWYLDYGISVTKQGTEGGPIADVVLGRHELCIRETFSLPFFLHLSMSHCERYQNRRKAGKEESLSQALSPKEPRKTFTI